MGTNNNNLIQVWLNNAQRQALEELRQTEESLNLCAKRLLLTLLENDNQQQTTGQPEVETKLNRLIQGFDQFRHQQYIEQEIFQKDFRELLQRVTELENLAKDRGWFNNGSVLPKIKTERQLILGKAYYLLTGQKVFLEKILKNGKLKVCDGIDFRNKLTVAPSDLLDNKPEAIEEVIEQPLEVIEEIIEQPLEVIEEIIEQPLEVIEEVIEEPLEENLEVPYITQKKLDFKSITKGITIVLKDGNTLEVTSKRKGKIYARSPLTKMTLPIELSDIAGIQSTLF